jgi:hypothetical protein
MARANSRKRANAETLILQVGYVEGFALIAAMPGIPRHAAVFAMMNAGKLAPTDFINRAIALEQSIDALISMVKFEVASVVVVTEF